MSTQSNEDKTEQKERIFKRYLTYETFKFVEKAKKFLSEMRTFKHQEICDLIGKMKDGKYQFKIVVEKEEWTVKYLFLFGIIGGYMTILSETTNTDLSDKIVRKLSNSMSNIKELTDEWLNLLLEDDS